jgi:6-phosphogluconolactonase
MVDNLSAMQNLNRRQFLVAASAAALATSSSLASAAPDDKPGAAGSHPRRVFLGSGSSNGILVCDFDPATGELTPPTVVSSVPKVAWLAFAHQEQFLYSASELDMFNGQPTGEVAGFRVEGGKLDPITTANSAGVGTCHVAIDRTGKMLVSADYGGGSAASFTIRNGKLSGPVWKEHYTFHGPNTDRQKSAHAHFISFSPDNRYTYINDLGGDCIHIYKPNIETAEMSPAGTYKGVPGSGPRTLHFHPNGHTAYCMNEIASTVDILKWNKADGSLSLVKRIELLPEGYSGPTRGCDTVISQNGRFVYFANRDDNFLYTFKADPVTGSLTAVKRSSCGGKTPRNFVLDPTERWMLVANQDSNYISVFKRDPATGAIAEEGKNFPVDTPMRILFTSFF